MGMWWGEEEKIRGARRRAGVEARLGVTDNEGRLQIMMGTYIEFI